MFYLTRPILSNDSKIYYKMVGDNMKYYKADDAPRNTPIWAVSYKKNNDDWCMPIHGEIRNNKFNYKLLGKEDKSVSCRNNYYADTFEEIVEVCNELNDLMCKKIDYFQRAILQAKIYQERIKNINGRINKLPL